MISTSGQEQQKKKRKWLSYCQRLLLGMEMKVKTGEKILSPFIFSVSAWLKSNDYLQSKLNHQTSRHFPSI